MMYRLYGEVVNNNNKGSLHFTLPTYSVFYTLPHRIQNRAMYLS